MLFGRYLAENDLLIHPEHGVAVSLDEVEELAAVAAATDKLAPPSKQAAMPRAPKP